MNEQNMKHLEVNDFSKLPKGRTNWARLVAMSDEEVEAAALSDPEAQPMDEESLARLRPMPNVKAIREGLDMTQEEFARAFHLSLGAIRDWEQLRKLPLGPSFNYLRVIAANPKAVLDALGKVS